MRPMLPINCANDYARNLGAAVLHSHVGLVHFDELGEIPHDLCKLNVYAIFVQDNFPENATYGVGGYDTSQGSLTAASPGQIIGKKDDGKRAQYHGWALMFDPDFMRGCEFEHRLADYHFFSYNVSEALFLTEEEKLIIWNLMATLREQLTHDAPTVLSDRIVQDYIILICDYCRLFYQRQFKTSTPQQSHILSRFNQVLTDYYERGLQKRYGLPNVKYCAGELCLSPSYFGDLIRGLLNESPNQVIQHFLVDRAKSMLVAGLPISDVAENLGFEYPQHFTRFFKKHTGIPPSKFIASLKSQSSG